MRVFFFCDLGDPPAAEGFDRLARAVEASGVGERVRARRDARLAARAALRDGRPGAAVNLLLQAQRRAPDHAIGNDLATAYVHAGKTKEAEDLLQKLLADSPDYTPARITLSSLRLKAGDPQSAEQLLKDAPQPADPQLRAELNYAKARARPTRSAAPRTPSTCSTRPSTRIRGTPTPRRRWPTA